MRCLYIDWDFKKISQGSKIIFNEKKERFGIKALFCLQSLLVKIMR